MKSEERIENVMRREKMGGAGALKEKENVRNRVFTLVKIKG